MDIQILGSTEQEIHALVKVPLTDFTWAISTIYASVDKVDRQILWKTLKNVVYTMNLSLVVMRDFNDIISQLEERGPKSEQ